MGKNFNGTQINQSPTISEKAGADVADIRNLILKYDTDGNVVVAADGTAPLLGVSIIESGYNDISGVGLHCICRCCGYIELAYYESIS